MRLGRYTIRRRRREDGAIAIMVALLAIVLFTVGALAVDLGNAYVHKKDIQKNTDFAALAGAQGDDLPMTAAGAACPWGTAANATDQAIKDVSEYLSRYYSPVSETTLTNCNLDDGEAAYGAFRFSGSSWTFTPNQNQISVISQKDSVSYGLAGILGINGTTVNGLATVEIKSPLMGSLPFYAKDACSWGNQTISQPTNGQVTGLHLYADTDTGTGRPLSLTTDPATSNPWTIPLNAASPSNTLVIDGDPGTFAGVTKVGFFQSGALTAGPDPEGTPDTTVSVAATDITNSNSRITITVPTAVTSIEGAWYVRVKTPTGGWSPLSTGSGSNTVTRALLLIVGQPTLTCGQGSDQGNFGTLDLEPANPPASGLHGVNDEISYNIIKGLTSTLDYVRPEDRTATGQCDINTPNVVMWDDEGTNCVTTQTGVPTQAAEQGFLTGLGSTYPKGLLQDVDSSHFCPNNYPSTTPHTATQRGLLINNDVLTCFLTDDTTTISQISSKTYSGGVVFDQSIYKSPRFVSVPVLTFPGNGSCCNWQILEFRPGFVTDQPATATRVTGAPIWDSQCGSNSNQFAGECNGIKYENGQLRAVNVVFINKAALPDPPIDPNGNYTPFKGGDGPKVPLLVE